MGSLNKGEHRAPGGGGPDADTSRAPAPPGDRRARDGADEFAGNETGDIPYALLELLDGYEERIEKLERRQTLFRRILLEYHGVSMPEEPNEGA